MPKKFLVWWCFGAQIVWWHCLHNTVNSRNRARGLDHASSMHTTLSTNRTLRTHNTLNANRTLSITNLSALWIIEKISIGSVKQGKIIRSKRLKFPPDLNCEYTFINLFCVIPGGCSQYCPLLLAGSRQCPFSPPETRAVQWTVRPPVGWLGSTCSDPEIYKSDIFLAAVIDHSDIDPDVDQVFKPWSWHCYCYWLNKGGGRKQNYWETF